MVCYSIHLDDTRRWYITLLTSSSAFTTVVEVIQFEVLRRLHLGHGLSLDDIDALDVLPALRSTNRFGLLYQMTQRCVLRTSLSESSLLHCSRRCAFRDKLSWTGMTTEFPANADGSGREISLRAHEPGIDDLRKRIDSIVPYFCANAGCVHAYCPYHGKVFLSDWHSVADSATIQNGSSFPSLLYPE
jgi:hypothetical protein